MLQRIAEKSGEREQDSGTDLGQALRLDKIFIIIALQKYCPGQPPK
jgi:hypothetical protein